MMVFKTFVGLCSSCFKSHSLWLKTNVKWNLWYSSNTKLIQLCKLTQLDFLALFKWPRTSQSQSVKIKPCNVEHFFDFIKAVMYSWIFFKSDNALEFEWMRCPFKNWLLILWLKKCESSDRSCFALVRKTKTSKLQFLLIFCHFFFFLYLSKIS